MGQLFRKIIQWIPLLFFAGSVLLQFFVLLSGARTTGVLRNFYWLQVDGTGAIDPEFGNTRWTNYRMCNWQDDQMSNCKSPQAGYPFSPENNFSEGDRGLIPSDFVDNRDTYYYLSRVGWAMLLVGLVFTVFSFFSTLLRVFIKWKLVSGLNWLNSVFAVFFVALGASLMTAAYVKGRNTFNDASGYDAKLGVKMFALMWASLALLLLSLPVFCFKKPVSSFHGGAGASSHDDSVEYKDDYVPPVVDSGYNGEPPATDYPPTQKRKLKFFKINRRTAIDA